MSLEATQHTPDGAKAFAEFFIKTIDWGYATTSSTYMRHYFQNTCVGCKSTAEALDSAANTKHHFVGDRFTLRSIEALSSTGATVTMRVTFDVNAGEVVDQKGKFVAGEPALNNFRERITLSWVGTGWLVVEFLAQR